ncbi:MAG: diguanylate cyclase [Sphingomonas paucimobilis]
MPTTVPSGVPTAPPWTAPALARGAGTLGMVRAFLLVCAMVGGAAAIGLITRHAFSVAFWPANAILVGAMLRAPQLYRPAGWGGAAAGFVLADLIFGQSPELGGWFAVANVSGTFVAVLVLRRLAPRDLRLRRVHSVMRISVGLLPGSFVAAMVGAVMVVVQFHGSATQTVMTWTASEIANYLIFLPAMLTVRPPWQRERRAMPAPAAKPLWPLLLLAVSCTLAVTFDGPGSIMFPMPALLLCAMTYSVSTAALVTMALGSGCMITIGLGMVDIGQDLSIPRMVVSIRIAVAFLALVPLTISSAMAVRDDLMAQLQQAADQDGLTGLLNRRAFEHRLHQRLAEPPHPAEGGLALLWLDLDHFKAINDRHGHPAGDAVLHAVAETLAGCCRADDLSARLGGEEFALAIASPDAAVTTALAERLRTAIAALSVEWHGSAIRATASIGAYHLDRWPVDGPALLHGLDEAMYRAKHAGRNRIEWVDPASLHRWAA